MEHREKGGCGGKDRLRGRKSERGEVGGDEEGWTKIKRDAGTAQTVGGTMT